MKLSKTINLLKWGFAVAVFGVAVYAIYQGWTYLKGLGSKATEALKPSQYKKGAEQTTFEKYFPNVAELKDKAIEAFKKNPIMPMVPFMQSFVDEKKSIDKTPPVTATPAKLESSIGQKAAVILPVDKQESKSVVDSMIEFFTQAKQSTSGKQVQPISYNKPGDYLSLSPPKQVLTPKINISKVSKPVSVSVDKRFR